MWDTTRMSGWSRGLAIALGLFVMGVGFAAIFYPAIVAGFVTFLFSVSFIIMGLWALSMGLSGQRMRVPSAQQMAQGQAPPRDREVPAQSQQ